MNPNATTTNDRVRDVIVQALSHQVALDVVMTEYPGHARELGERARRDRLDVVITLGGDGTINEAVNGMLVDGPGADVPALATVPGGSGNVLARSAGIPRDPVEATGVILHGLADHRYRTISLGVANGRWFTMSVGMGLDAEIVSAMEGQRADGKKATPVRYFRTTLEQYFVSTNRRAPALALEQDGGDQVEGVFAAIVLNAAPFTFFGQMPINPLPDASFDAGLDVFAIQDLRVLPMLRWSRRMMAGSRAGSARGLHVGHDLDRILLTAERPTAVQIDGEGLGEFSELLIENVPKAIRLVV